jgi:predicted phosphodiesterase
MKLQLLSDIHLDEHQDGGERFFASLRPEGVELLIVAGDLAEADSSYEGAVAQLCQMYRHVLITPGNHEYYDTEAMARSVQEKASERTKRLAKLEDKFPNLVYAAEPKVLKLNGFKILAGTMWFKDEPDNILYSGLMSDFRWISGLVPWAYEQNALFRKLLETELVPGDVVVTHHLPTFASVHEHFVNSPTNRFFVSDQEDLIRERQPAYWLHGHTHTGLRTKVGKTRIICNPFGYPLERRLGLRYRPNLFIRAGR